ncbi:hypothetical protein HG531_009643 [Fusarium graminearum]|nr:hypothetical protein HG531_009643 [Fusarium graminearum]
MTSSLSISSTHIDITISVAAASSCSCSTSVSLLRILPPLQALLHPLFTCGITTLGDLTANNALHHLTRKANKVVSSQSILKHPVSSLALLPRQQLLVAKVSRSLSQVPAHGEEVESDLGAIVSCDSALENVHNLCRKFLRAAGTVRDGSGLQAVELIECAIDRCVSDEMEGILCLCTRLIRLVGKGAAASKAVVHLPDEVRVTKRLTAELRWQHHGEFSKVAQLLAYLDIFRLVQQHAEEGLCSTGILDRLCGEEDVLGGGVVEGAVAGSLGCRIGLIGRVLEEEDHAVDRMQGEKLGWVEGEEFFELNVFDAEVLDEGGKNTLFSLC